MDYDLLSLRVQTRKALFESVRQLRLQEQLRLAEQAAAQEEARRVEFARVAKQRKDAEDTALALKALQDLRLLIAARKFADGRR